MPNDKAYRGGFTLPEVLLALMIFSFMSVSLATLYSTANRHMFQNYRHNTIATNADLAMRVIQNKLAQATRLDVPKLNQSGNQLGVAENVDQISGCYPVSAGSPVVWHYFCLGQDAADPAVTDLYYHTGTLAGGPGCPAAAGTWSGVYPVPVCGAAIGGQTVTVLMQFIATPANPSGRVFSRSTADGPIGSDEVAVNLRSFWDSTARGFGGSKRQKNVDFSLSSVLRANRPAYSPTDY